VFGVAFMLRALGDAAPAAHWLVYVSPLGWIEQLHPLAGLQPIWLLPIAALTAVLVALAMLLAGRDLGTSIIADAATAHPHTRFLNSPAGLAWRLSRTAIIGWLTAAILAGLLYGSLTRSAAQAFTSSGAVGKFTGSLTGSAQHQGAAIYAGVIFLILMTLVMAYTASAIAGVREQEAEAYLDNLLVRTVSRSRWLAGRTALIAVVTIAAGVLAGVAFWTGTAAQHTGLTAGELLLAGINAVAPAMLLGGIAVFTLGFWPRATGLAAYGVLAWSFLLEMLGSAISVNHWVMDTSLLHHIALAPAANPNWRIIGTYLALGVLLAAAGAWRFNRRDLQTE
jgi:ABC-2 type transport system permease protein